MRKRMFAGMMVLGFLLVVTTASPGLAAYSSHQNDQDVNNFLAVYPFAKSTKLDDCSLCHPGGTVGSKTYGSCDYCHITYGLTEPHGPVPLNGYGQAYMDAGTRDEEAIRSIEGADSDVDTYSNIQEINALTFPGDSSDYPGLTPALAVVLNQERIMNLPDHSEFLFLNTTKSGDWYARYRGVKIKDLLKSVGIRPGATQITVFAPDGFSKTFPIDAPDPQTDAGTVQYDVMGPYPRGHYFGGLDFVEYSFLPDSLSHGNKISDNLYMLLGYLRDGDPLTRGKLVPDPGNPTRLVLDGEGPYRLIPPQKIAGSPDRPSTSAPVGDGWDYDNLKDHNAGSSIRSTTAIRVEPLPTGTTDFNWIEGGWNLVDQAKLVIYGAIDPQRHPVWGKVEDTNGDPIDGVKIAFGLLSLGQAGEDMTDENGKFRTRLPAGEYRVVPSKEGYTFTPASALISLSKEGFDLNFTATPMP
jgi:hypothetical protein